MRVASLDIGSYTARMLVAETLTESKDFLPLARERDYINVADFYEKNTGIIKQKAVENTVKVIKKFLEKAKKLGTQKFYAVATGAIREAKNREEFIAQIKELTGIKATIISGEKEAQLTSEGVIHSLKLRKDTSFMIVDIGGGSTEFFIKTKNMPYICSIPLGAAVLQNKENAAFYVKNMLRENFGNIVFKAEKLIGTGGTITTLVAMAHGITFDKVSPENLNGKVLTLKQAKDIFEDLISMNLQEMIDKFGLDKNRAKVIIPGTIILLSIMEFFGFSQIIASLSDILEGIILRCISHFKS